MANIPHRRARSTAATAVGLLLLSTLPLALGAGGAADAATAGDACGALTAKPGGGTWSCSFVEDFTASSLDTTKWSYDDSGVTGFYMSDTCFVSGKNFAQGGGTARLSLTRAPAGYVCHTPYADVPATYIGSDITTWGKFNQTYGKFEARLKYPSYASGGYHGGFWLNPQTNSFGPWPKSGELDIAEWWSSQATHVFPSAHFEGEDGYGTGWNCIISTPSSYHVYGLEWTEGLLKFTQDGKVCFSIARADTPDLQTLDPFVKPFYISLSWADGGTLGPPTSSTPIPGVVTVDWVKVWK